MFFSIAQQSNTFQNNLISTPNYWQQHVDYSMKIHVDVDNYTYKGTQKLVYTNNSPDELKKVFYHLYFNAFQPGSEMDIRLQNVPDPDRRMVTNLGTKENPKYESRISKLQPNEIGYIHVSSLKQNGKVVDYIVEGTVLEVTLNTSIKPGEKVVFDMIFDAQVPVQIRRSGRENKDGVALSMTQWYPKLAEYDFEGWQAHPYIAREFQGVFGDFDITININKDYTIGGTGVLQNPQEIGHGYYSEKLVKKLKSTNLSWHFKASNVHDFAWTADDEYIHDVVKIDNGPTLHFLYKNNKEIKQNWKNLQPKAVEMMRYFSDNIGKYPYEQYSILQGGDGGMEYAMCTLISGGTGSLIGLTAHEMAHTWFQQILATNESKHPWMDEGFTEYLGRLCVDKILNRNNPMPFLASYKSYTKLVAYGMEEPLTTHADRYQTNAAYGIASYDMGLLFLTQLKYIIGEENLNKSIKQYYSDFKFKHPTPNDFKRIAEKISGIQLDWYLNEWTQTTNKIDYRIKEVNKNEVILERIGNMPMPIDITVIYADGKSEDYYIPLRMMRGEKPTTATILPDWAWAYPTYTFTTKKEIQSIEIDKSGLMADVDKKNNVFKN